MGFFKHKKRAEKLLTANALQYQIILSLCKSYILQIEQILKTTPEIVKSEELDVMYNTCIKLKENYKGNEYATPALDTLSELITICGKLLDNYITTSKDEATEEIDEKITTLLDKIKTTGVASLTDDEKEFLNKNL